MGVVFNNRRHGHKFNRPRDIASRRNKPGRNNPTGTFTHYSRFDADACYGTAPTSDRDGLHDGGHCQEAPRTGRRFCRIASPLAKLKTAAS